MNPQSPAALGAIASGRAAAGRPVPPSRLAQARAPVSSSGEAAAGTRLGGTRVGPYNAIGGPTRCRSPVRLRRSSQALEGEPSSTSKVSGPRHVTSGTSVIEAAAGTCPGPFIPTARAITGSSVAHGVRLLDCTLSIAAASGIKVATSREGAPTLGTCPAGLGTTQAPTSFGPTRSAKGFVTTPSPVTRGRPTRSTSSRSFACPGTEAVEGLSTRATLVSGPTTRASAVASAHAPASVRGDTKVVAPRRRGACPASKADC